MSDCERILEYMKKHHGITVAECRDYLGTTELRRRICDLKEKGFQITDIWENGGNRVGVPTRYKRYVLVKGK